MNRKQSSGSAPKPSINERLISLGPGTPPIPERLLLAHARGEVLFIAGAGVSQQAELPDFRGLVLEVYRSLDGAVHDVLDKLPDNAFSVTPPVDPGMSAAQMAEMRRFMSGDYDVVLGMLERRMDGPQRTKSSVRRAIADTLRAGRSAPADIHRALVRLADRGEATTLVTTNFDRLFEAAGKAVTPKLQTYSLGGMPRPSRADDFAGILHIHGVLDADSRRTSEMVVTDQDFGEYYLRRRLIPDFIYDAARLYNLVLVGYSANDPPMRYLLNAVAADGTRFRDLNERFTFIGSDQIDPVAIEDWKGRGITPIPYSRADGHAALLDVLKRWANLTRRSGNTNGVETEIKRIARLRHSEASDEDRDLFDHLFRRSPRGERPRLSSLASAQNADLAWLDAISNVALEHDRWTR